MIKSYQIALVSGDKMIFISLNKFRKKPTKEAIAESSKLMKLAEKDGVKFLNIYWTLGRYDSVAICEAKDVKANMKALLRWGDILSSETLAALPREDAIKLIEK
jgi:uncharacterized protein with GYD domain